MAPKLCRWSRRRPFIAAVCAVCLFSGLLMGIGHASDLYSWRAFASDVEDLNRVSDGERSCVSWTFGFRGSQVTVTARLGAEELARAEAISTKDVFGSDGWLRSRYVSYLVVSQSEGRFVELLAEDLERTADELGLDDDGRLELTVAAVQYIPYGDIRREIRLPIEVVAYRSGVCTEKSILLAALMVRQGWDTCVWIFDYQRHVGVGVAAEAVGFHATDYAFIETTGPAYIGQADDSYRSRGPRARPPQFVRVGDGERRYRAGEQVAYILGVLDLAERGAVRLWPYHGFADAASGELGSRYRDIANVQAQASGLADYIVENSNDRPRVYEVLRLRRGLHDIDKYLTWNSARSGSR